MGRPKKDDLKKINLERENLARLYADKVINEHKTIRKIAEECHTSKSTVHKDVTERMEEINPSLAAKARKILDINKSERHIRGGMATKEKYHHLHEMM